MKQKNSGPITRLFHGYGDFPNNSCFPLIVFKSPFHNVDTTPEYFERCFRDHSWPGAWRNGLFDFHHYHSSAHEVLGIYSGWVQACFGGPEGEILEASKGDVIIIPAGVAHCNMGQSSDFMVVGGYPIGQPWDMMYGKPGERPQSDHNISKVPMPLTDPVFGPEGPLLDLWS